MHQFILGESTTVTEPESAGLTLLSSCSYSERMFIVGFNLCQRFFYHASELMLHMRYAAKQVDHHDPDSTRDISVSQRTKLIQSYVKLTTVLDEAPRCLQSFAGADGTSPGSPNQVSGLLGHQVQVANLLITNNHLRMLVTQRCAEDRLHSILGLPQDALLLDLRRSKIARDMVHVIRDAPFEALRINGEPLVFLSNVLQKLCHVLIRVTLRKRKSDWSEPLYSRLPVGLEISSSKKEFGRTLPFSWKSCRGWTQRLVKLSLMALVPNRPRGPRSRMAAAENLGENEKHQETDGLRPLDLDFIPQ